MQTPLSVSGITKAMVEASSASHRYSTDTSTGAHKKQIMAPTPVTANHEAWRANSVPTRSGA